PPGPAPARPRGHPGGPPPGGPPRPRGGTTAPATTAQPPGAPGTRADSRRALLFGAAGGALFGLAAALTDFVAGRFGDGLAAVLGSWQTWALVAAGLLGVYLQQRAFQVGSLAAALPAATVAEPLAAAFLGLTVLDERLRADGFALVVVVVAVLVLAVAAVALARAEAAD
ncbi:DMT family transporter, partial [Nocardia farcinica]|uniref:DMT family transporter n=1 Tax=Nocardia farcinica TaxID=37329 RepID=UPI0024538FF0